jgi:hypothetical protein
MADELASRIAETITVYVRRKGGRLVVMRDVTLQATNTIGVMIAGNGNWIFLPWPLIEGMGGAVVAGASVLNEVDDLLKGVG